MTVSIIITICVLLILAYIFDISSSFTKIPSVILLLLIGWTVRQITVAFDISIPDLTQLLPILGTIGLILIVLEGSLELELNKSKISLINKTALIALFSMLFFAFALAFAFQYFGDTSFKNGLANAIPFAIISSAIAIPSAQNLLAKDKEFITYESSLSDIFGVIFFNFITLNETINTQSVGNFILDIVIILVVTTIATIGLAYLLSKINHHVKFLPIILIIVLIYTITKIYHLPGLIFILLLGIFLGNLDELKSYRFIQILHPEILNKEVHKFKELTIEVAFLVRSLFFLLFGYLINTSELLNTDTIIWALGICFGIYLIRIIFIKLFSLSIQPLLYIAPRGLITILLFLSIPVNQSTSLANNSLIIQVIILTALMMMFGLLTYKPTKTNTNE
jgi:Kef-type K+ transport system membrane component KefB